MAGGCILDTATWSLKFTFNSLVVPRGMYITFNAYMSWEIDWSLTTIYQPQIMVFHPQNTQPHNFSGHPHNSKEFRAARSSFFLGLMKF